MPSAQPMHNLQHKKTPMDSNTHVNGITHTYIYVQIQKHYVTDSKSPYLSSHCITLNICASTNPNHNPNPKNA